MIGLARAAGAVVVDEDRRLPAEPRVPGKLARRAVPGELFEQQLLETARTIAVVGLSDKTVIRDIAAKVGEGGGI